MGVQVEVAAASQLQPAIARFDGGFVALLVVEHARGIKPGGHQIIIVSRTLVASDCVAKQLLGFILFSVAILENAVLHNHLGRARPLSTAAPVLFVKVRHAGKRPAAQPSPLVFGDAEPLKPVLQ